MNAQLTERYILYQKVEGRPEGVNADLFIGLPIERIGINSTTHLGFLNAIEQQEKIVAMSNQSLYYDAPFQNRIEKGLVEELGNRTLNVEKVIASELDVLFSFAIDATSYKAVKDLRDLGQPVVLISEFNESHPIDKAKWLKVFAAFFQEDVQKLAAVKLKRIEKRYDSLKVKAKLYSTLPKVMIGLPWKGTWYVSGANSYQAQLISDAGAIYLWSKYPQTQSVPLDIETAISQTLDADFWINPGIAQSYSELEENNPAFTRFVSFKNKNVYTNYKRSNKLGANDYWELGVVRPDLVLQDLIAIIHSEELDSLTFYQSLAQ